MVTRATPTKEEAMAFLGSMANDAVVKHFVQGLLAHALGSDLEQYMKHFATEGKELRQHCSVEEQNAAHYTAGYIAGLYRGVHEMLHAVKAIHPELFEVEAG